MTCPGLDLAVVLPREDLAGPVFLNSLQRELEPIPNRLLKTGRRSKAALIRLTSQEAKKARISGKTRISRGKMKGLGNLRETVKSPQNLWVALMCLACIFAFILGKRWSQESLPLIFFTRGTSWNSGRAPYVAISTNAKRTFDISHLIANASFAPTIPLPEPPPSPLPKVYRPPPPPSLERFGIVDESGVMNDSSTVDFDPDLIENHGLRNETEEASVVQVDIGRVIRVKKFHLCPASEMEYIPCMDNWGAIHKLKSTERGEKFERHCPEAGNGLNCLVPAPKNYKTPIPWPRSRNEMVPEIVFGSHIRVVLDIGCGVASFGAYLFLKNVITMSIAPKDVHENQIQFALERGVPAMVAAFATHRLLFPSEAFDLIHCSRCRINWTRDDGILLLEVNRMLRAGGYFVWAAQPVYKHEQAQQKAWEEMEDLTARICWELLKKEGYIAIWRKPLNNTCYASRDTSTQPTLCTLDDDPDDVWYVNLKACLTKLPENSFGSNMPPWPARLHMPPQRLQNVLMDAKLSRNELFKAETAFWDEIVGSYVNAFHWKNMNLRNVMDMRAGFGGFAAAMIDNKLDVWVMNVVPTSEPNTLPSIYDRGLIGVAHDWCEPFDTYPRTYDLLHAFGLLSREQKRCNITSMLLEMDRILRPSGHVYIRDSKYIIDEIQQITRALGWRANLHDTSEGPYASRKILICQKYPIF